MKKQEVLETLCELATKVMTEKFGCSVSADCFCGKNMHINDATFSFSNEVMNFIIEAVNEKLNAPTNNTATEFADGMAIGMIYDRNINLISLIKFYRHITGMGLKDSKDAVEAMILKRAESINCFKSMSCKPKEN
jgi:ribosomal protein L7/L12